HDEDADESPDDSQKCRDDEQDQWRDPDQGPDQGRDGDCRVRPRPMSGPGARAVRCRGRGLAPGAGVEGIGGHEFLTCERPYGTPAAMATMVMTTAIAVPYPALKYW